jgi:hypothetical protein
VNTHNTITILHTKVICGYLYKEAEQGNVHKRAVKGRKASWSSTTGTNCGAQRVSYGFLLFASLTETRTQRKYKKELKLGGKKEWQCK